MGHTETQNFRPVIKRSEMKSVYQVWLILLML